MRAANENKRIEEERAERAEKDQEENQEEDTEEVTEEEEEEEEEEEGRKRVEPRKPVCSAPIETARSNGFSTRELN